MVGTIMPLVQVAKGRAIRVFAFHGFGSVIGGAAVGAWLGLMGAALLAPVEGVVLVPVYFMLAGVASIYAASELGIVNVPLLEREAQVPERWRRKYGVEFAMLAYGVMLGAGFLTFVVNPVLYIAFSVALLSMNPAVGALIGLTFGIARLLPMLPPTIVAVASKRHLTTSEQMRLGLAQIPSGVATLLMLAGATGILIGAS